MRQCNLPCRCLSSNKILPLKLRPDGPYKLTCRNARIGQLASTIYEKFQFPNRHIMHRTAFVAIIKLRILDEKGKKIISTILSRLSILDFLMTIFNTDTSEFQTILVIAASDSRFFSFCPQPKIHCLLFTRVTRSDVAADTRGAKDQIPYEILNSCITNKIPF